MTQRSAKRTTSQARLTPRRTDLQINLADRALGWVIPAFIGIASAVAVAVILNTIAQAINHYIQALP